MPAPLTAQQSALTLSKRQAGSRQEVAAAAEAPAGAKARSALKGPRWPISGAVPLTDQPGEIGFCDFTKVKRGEMTLRGEPFPHLLAACGGVPKELRTARLHHDRLIVVLGSDWTCQRHRAYGNGGHGRYQRHLFPNQLWWDYTARRRCSRRRTNKGMELCICSWQDDSRDSR
jgi:hypothetical protein